MNKPEITINLRRFRAALKSTESGEEAIVFLTLDKTQLQAAQLCGQSSKELIERFAARNGYELLDAICGLQLTPETQKAAWENEEFYRYNP